MEFETNRSDEQFPRQVPRDPRDEWERDLNPDPLGGQNVGSPSADADDTIPASELQAVQRALSEEFDADDLRQIPIVRDGVALQQGATYIDLRDPGRQEFTAMGGTRADPARWYVPKRAVPYSIWNRLIGVEDRDRTDEGPLER